MSLEVLQTTAEIDRARARLEQMGASALVSPWRARLARLLARLQGKHRVDVGDRLKSWDVLKSVEFLEANVAKDDPILDIGAYASEVLVSLDRRGFTNLTGVDLNPNVIAMPGAARVRYVVSDFMQTPFEDATFAAITSISVIEHGYQPDRLLAEVARLLRPGGVFIASTDYWQEKIDTGGRTYFDMSWLIFSEQDVGRMVEIGQRHGLELVGDWRPTASSRAISHGGFDYTFAWIALKKAM